MNALLKLDPNNKELNQEIILGLIEQYGGEFYTESADFISENNHLAIIEALTQRNKTTYLAEELKYVDQVPQYSSYFKYNSEDILGIIKEDTIFVDIDQSSINSIRFIDSRINTIIEKLAEVSKIKPEITEDELNELKDAGISEYECEIHNRSNQISINPIQAKQDESTLEKIKGWMGKVEDAVLLATRNIQPHHVKIGVAAVGIGLSMFGSDAFAGDNDAMMRLMKVKAEMMAKSGDAQLKTDILKAIGHHFHDFFEGTNKASATIDHPITFVGGESVAEQFKIAITDSAKKSCNFEFNISNGEVTGAITKNDWGDLCKGELNVAKEVLIKHFSRLAKN